MSFLTFGEYKITGGRMKIADLLAMPDIDDIELDLPPLRDLAQLAEFSWMFLLDTNVVSELRKIRSGKADRHVAAWADSVEAIDLYLSAIIVQKLEIEVLLAERRDPSQEALLRAWLNGHVLPASQVEFCPSIPLWLNAAPTFCTRPSPGA